MRDGDVYITSSFYKTTVLLNEWPVEGCLGSDRWAAMWLEKIFPTSHIPPWTWKTSKLREKCNQRLTKNDVTMLLCCVMLYITAQCFQYFTGWFCVLDPDNENIFKRKS